MTGDGTDCFAASCEDLPEEASLDCQYDCELQSNGLPGCVCPVGWSLHDDGLQCVGMHCALGVQFGVKLFLLIFLSLILQKGFFCPQNTL